MREESVQQQDEKINSLKAKNDQFYQQVRGALDEWPLL